MMKNTAVLSLLAALPLAAEETKPVPVVAIYDLEGSISESGRGKDSLFGLESTRPLTVFDISRSLAKAATDPLVKAVVRGSSVAEAEALVREALALEDERQVGELLRSRLEDRFPIELEGFIPSDRAD